MREAPSAGGFRELERRVGAAAPEEAARAALAGAVGRRIAGLLGEERLDASRYAAVMLQTTPTERTAWDPERASLVATRVELAADGDPILVLGERAADAFGIAPEPLTWAERGSGQRLAFLPHPTPRAAFWRVHEHAEEAVAFLRAARVGLESPRVHPEVGGWTFSPFGPWDPEAFAHGGDFATRADAARSARASLPAGCRFWTARLFAARAAHDLGPLVPRIAWVSRDRV